MNYALGSFIDNKAIEFIKNSGEFFDDKVNQRLDEFNY